MTQTSMKKDFIDEQLCTEASIYLNEQTDGEIIASFEGVKLLKLDSIIDITNMRSSRFNLENSPHTFISDAIINHHLLFDASFNNNETQDLENRLNKRFSNRNIQSCARKLADIGAEYRRNGQMLVELLSNYMTVLYDVPSWTGLNKIHAITMDSSKSDFLIRTSEFNYTWTENTTIATLVLAQYFNQFGGALWASILYGLAYEQAVITVKPDMKVITLELD
uniref:Uncharacterized protein n=1 Tax=Meloidogyne javanica TaxID=6303 RepID=A0A915M185_MELJA